MSQKQDHFNLYHTLGEAIGRAAGLEVEGATGSHAVETISLLLSSAIVLSLVWFGAFLYSRNVNKRLERKEFVPDGKFSLVSVVDGLVDIVYGIAKDNSGGHVRFFLPIFSAIFLFVLASNLSGLIPGLPPATESMGINFAMGLIVFFSYNYAGFKEHGPGYLKQFAGPILAIAPLFILIELVSHLARPFSLSLRLMGNIYADHLMVGLFTSLTYFVVPSLLMFFGLLVAFVQSFIFTLMSGIYVSMAVSHDH